MEKESACRGGSASASGEESYQTLADPTLIVSIHN
jgi:hypothetical protein